MTTLRCYGERVLSWEGKREGNPTGAGVVVSAHTRFGNTWRYKVKKDIGGTVYMDADKLEHQEMLFDEP